MSHPSIFVRQLPSIISLTLFRRQHSSASLFCPTSVLGDHLQEWQLSICSPSPSSRPGRSYQLPFQPSNLRIRATCHGPRSFRAKIAASPVSKMIWCLALSAGPTWHGTMTPLILSPFSSRAKRATPPPSFSMENPKYCQVTRLSHNLILTACREFPQLSNNPQMSGASQPSMWGGQAARNLGGPARNPSTSIPQSSQQEDMFSSVGRISSSQNSFRFGGQASIGQPPQSQPSGGDDYPPLMNRNGNGEIGQERSANLTAGLGFGSQAPGGQTNRSGNGLLNAVTASARTSEVRSPVGARPVEGMSSIAIADDDARRKSAYREDGVASLSSIPDGSSQPTELRNSLASIGNDASASKSTDGAEELANTAVQDPLTGMSDADKWGIKGLLTLMVKYPSYNALAHGMNPADLGLDLTSDV